MSLLKSSGKSRPKNPEKNPPKASERDSPKRPRMNLEKVREKHPMKGRSKNLPNRLRNGDGIDGTSLVTGQRCPT